MASKRLTLALGNFVTVLLLLVIAGSSAASGQGNDGYFKSQYLEVWELEHQRNMPRKEAKYGSINLVDNNTTCEYRASVENRTRREVTDPQDFNFVFSLSWECKETNPSGQSTLANSGKIHLLRVNHIIPGQRTSIGAITTIDGRAFQVTLKVREVDCGTGFCNDLFQLLVSPVGEGHKENTFKVLSPYILWP